MKMLFICKHNRFRSKVAEAIFEKLGKGRNEVKSAGIQIDFTRPWIAESVKKELEKRGYTVDNEQSREINSQDVKWADKIVIVADNVSPSLFPKEKTEQWKIRDADEKDGEKIKKIVDEIEGKVKKLVLILH